MAHAVVFAFGVAISPIPIGAILVILSGRGVSPSAIFFAAGWVTGVALSAVVFAVLVSGLVVTRSRLVWIGVVYLVLGGGFVAVAVKWWLQRRPGRLHPSWLDRVDRFTPVDSATLGVVLSCANPKVLALSLGAALSVARSHADGLLVWLAVCVFVGIGAAGVLIPIAAYVAMPIRGAALLGMLHRWLLKHERVVFPVLALAIGGFFVREGVESLMP